MSLSHATATPRSSHSRSVSHRPKLSLNSTALANGLGLGDIDVIASGGITSGAGIAACLALGAAAVQIGIAFLVAVESGATPEWKKAVVTSADADTLITHSLTGRGARAVPNELIGRMTELEDQLPDYPILNNYTAAIRQRAQELGQAEYQSLWTGQAGSAIRSGSAAEIFHQLIAELDLAIQSFGDD